MKNPSLCFLTVVILFFAGCKGNDPINPPEPPVVEKFTVTGIPEGSGTINPTSCTVDKGGTAVFAIKPDVGWMTSYLKDGNTMLPPTNLYTVRDISESDTFHVIFKKDSVMFPVLRIKWLQTHDFSFANGKWTEWSLPDPIGFTFNLDGTYTETWNGITITGIWSLDRNVSPMILKISGYASFVVETINENVLSIYYTTSGGIIYKLIFGNVGYK